MIKRICPICDQTMDSAHFCKNCRRFIKNPWVREVGYYLNERHPSSDHTCSYHDDPFEVDRQRSIRRSASASERYDGKRSSTTWAPQKSKQSNSGRERAGSGKKSGKNRWILIIFLIYLMFQIVIPIMVGLIHTVFWYWF